MDLLNILFALLSIGLGAISWLNPKYTMGALDLHGTDSTMGMSEVRASVGCLFVGMGVGALIFGTPEAYAMLGFCWLGASVGRLTSLLKDGQSQQKWVFFAVEAAVGVPAVLFNI